MINANIGFWACFDQAFTFRGCFIDIPWNGSVWMKASMDFTVLRDEAVAWVSCLEFGQQFVAGLNSCKWTCIKEVEAFEESTSGELSIQDVCARSTPNKKGKYRQNRNECGARPQKE